MLGLNFKLDWQPERVTRAADKGAYKSFAHAAASIRKSGQARIIKRPKVVGVAPVKRGKGKRRQRGRQIAAPVGHSPYTRRGEYKRAITFDASKTGAVIGPRYSRLGTAGEAHEHGGRYKGEDFPQRPTMGPALSENLSRFAGGFAGSIG